MFGIDLGFSKESSESKNKQKYAYAPAIEEQGDFFKDLLKRFQSGQGGYGFGNFLRSGNETLGRGMAGRGISPDSGVYQSAMSNMIANAMATAGQNRDQYGLNLAQLNPNIQMRQQWGYNKGSGSQIGAGYKGQWG